MKVAFLNENTLGHTSYLPRFAGELARRPELGIEPVVLDALPLPASLRRWGETSVRGLRKFGLDFHGTRWRVAISRHIRQQLDVVRARERVEALVVNTQSAGLELDGISGIPLWVALDATFQQLADSPWFAPNAPSRWLQPVTLSGLWRRERALFRQATGFFPWSERVAASLRRDYGIPAERLVWMPPSLEPPARRESRPANLLPQILFLGGDFNRKGGPLLRSVFERHFAGRAELHLVTQSEIPPGPSLHVHRGVTAGSPEWRQRWEAADVFVFPSRLETFGIVLLEALAFEVPVISSDAGAAGEILGGVAGVRPARWGSILPDLTEAALREALEAWLAEPRQAREKAQLGRDWFEKHYRLSANTERLAECLKRSVRA